MKMTMSKMLSSIGIEVIRTVYYYYFFIKIFCAKENTQALFKYLNTLKKNIIKNTSNFHSDANQ